jgi:hypothetical protein
MPSRRLSRNTLLTYLLLLVNFLLTACQVRISDLTERSCTDIMSEMFPIASMGNEELRGKKNPVDESVLRSLEAFSRNTLRAKCYISSSLRRKVDALGNFQSNVKGEKISETLNKIKRVTDPFLFGGSVRDLLEGKQPSEVKDIDINFGSLSKMEDLCDENSWSCTDRDQIMQYIKFGTHKYSLEGKSYLNTLDVDVCVLENSVNAFLYSVHSDFIIDMTGVGYDDMRSMILTRTCNNPEEWLKNGKYTALRAFKMLSNGYSMSDDYFDFWHKTLSIQIKSLDLAKLRELLRTFFCEKVRPTVLAQLKTSITRVPSESFNGKIKNMMLFIGSLTCPGRLLYETNSSSIDSEIHTLERQILNVTALLKYDFNSTI